MLFEKNGSKVKWGSRAPPQKAISAIFGRNVVMSHLFRNGRPNASTWWPQHRPPMASEVATAYLSRLWTECGHVAPFWKWETKCEHLMAFWATSGHPVAILACSGHFALHLATLAPCGHLLDTLGHIWPPWRHIGIYWPFWATSGHPGAILGFSGHCRPHPATLTPYWDLLAFVGHFRPHPATLAPYWALLGILGHIWPPWRHIGIYWAFWGTTGCAVTKLHSRGALGGRLRPPKP